MPFMQKRHIVSAVLVLLILLAGAAYWAYERGALAWKDGQLVFSKEALTNPVPSLDREPNFPPNFTDAAKDIYYKKVAELSDTLKSDPTNFEAWLDLAIYYRMVNDHEGAVEAWEYLRRMYPQDGISRHNLAEYYFRTAKDYAKSEEYYRESIAIAPNLESNYLDLYEMYRYVYKQDTNAAIDILLEGADKLVGVSEIQFHIMLGQHYRDVLKDTENARKYLTLARDAASARGDRSVANDLTAQINAL